VQLVPHVRSPPGRAQPGDPQLRTEPVGDRLELVELVDVLPGHHHADLRVAEPGLGQVLQSADRGVVGAGAADVVVDLGGRPIQRNLDVDVVGGGQLRSALLVELDPVGGEFDPTSWLIA
jgi:hypothetical protein